MHHILPESSGPAGPGTLEDDRISQGSNEPSSSLPFGRHIPFTAISGPTYVTAQVLIQHTAYALSDRIFTYSPDTCDLDVAVRHWSLQGAHNAYGFVTGVSSMQIRPGAGSIALGYVCSKDFNPEKRHLPQSLIGSTSSLRYLRATLSQLFTLHHVGNPIVVHVAAVDYAAGAANSLVSDYSAALSIAEELGLGMVCSTSAHESQHMALFSTLLSNLVPTIHIYDGVTTGRQTTRVIDGLNVKGLYATYTSVLEEVKSAQEKAENQERRLRHLLRAFNGELGTAYELFEYHGHESPEHVLVVFGTVESSLSVSVAKKLAKAGRKVGVLNVRVYRPFAEEDFLDALPLSVRNIAVLGQVYNQREVDDASTHSTLYDDVLAAVTFSNRRLFRPSVVDVKYAREQVWTPVALEAVFWGLGRKLTTIFQLITEFEAQTAEVSQTSVAATTQRYIFWDVDESLSVNAPSMIGELLARDSSRNISLRAVHDDVTHGGVKRTDIRSSKKSVENASSVEEADVVYVGNLDLFKDINVVRSVKPSGTLLVQAPDLKDEDLEKKFSAADRKAIAEKGIKLHILSPPANTETNHHIYITVLAFLKLARPDLLETGLAKVTKINGEDNISERILTSLSDCIRETPVPQSWTAIELDEEEKPALPTDIKATSFTSFDKQEPQHPSLLRTWHSIAKTIAFKEAYGTKPALRPDLAAKTWTVYVKENRRLTPITYDRNIFHIEFDLGTSGLKYEIGEALGIHGENDETEVNEFIKFYGLQPEEIVEVPSREDPDVLEARTVYQSLMQNVDIFGRPPKKFYEALAEFADDENEKKELLTMAGPEGATEFKRRAEVDTITYADILLEFPSAHPSFHDIVKIVSPMKRREYSIASSQKVTPNSVALLVVTVGWVDPKGRDRFGQATRYLAKLAVGSPVTVSVKPSVMKLPTEATQPLIMAGLGTGLAPFRAFVQYRAWQKAQGIDIGSVLLYMGSRHQREEYLYGEEWEAYQAAGVITLLGRAFSRDQRQKIYIQDRMRQTMSDIIQAYIKDRGSFYLCGPTWPVPDVTEVLQEAISLEAKADGRKVDSRKEIERLKDDLRYVLEVY
ncbi:MAG: hypothetical protein M1816_004587 [Peltula sp. TS41687]|nr:MAG: hypothetical protein M1816_004587 [Peltula sp. TS41687]